MRCDDADVMMMQKEKQAKYNLGKNPGALQCDIPGIQGDQENRR